MEEIWKDIKFTDTDGKEYDYTGYYQVSNMGRVKSLSRKGSRKERVLKTKPNNQGYIKIGLNVSMERKTFAVHRLVAHMFIENPNPNEFIIVNHKDENPANNCVDNLEWCTQSHNVQHSHYKYKCDNRNRTYYTGGNNASAKKVLCVETGQVFGSIVEAKQWLGKGDINACVKGRNETAGGYHWQYVDDTDE